MTQVGPAPLIHPSLARFFSLRCFYRLNLVSLGLIHSAIIRLLFDCHFSFLKPQPNSEAGRNRIEYSRLMRLLTIRGEILGMSIRIQNRCEVSFLGGNAIDCRGWNVRNFV